MTGPILTLTEGPIELRVFKAKVREDEAAIFEIRLQRPITPMEAGGFGYRLAAEMDDIRAATGDATYALITGRAPIWLYAIVLHEVLHQYQVIATYDPKLRGYIIVASHAPQPEIGTVIDEKEVKQQ